MSRSIRLLVLAGPTGSGKTYILHALERLDPRFRVAPIYVTRPPRAAVEIHRICVSVDAFKKSRSAGEFVCSGESTFGGYYGIKGSDIFGTVRAGGYPAIDTAPEGIDDIRNAVGIGMFTVFVLPPTLAALRRRLKGRDGNLDRLERAKRQRAYLASEDWDMVVVSEEGKGEILAKAVRSAYLTACGF